MTDEMMNLRTLVEKASDTDILREMIGFAAERLMELEVGARTGAAYSTRSVDDLVKAMGGTGVSRSQVSRLCAEIDDKVKAFLDRPLEGDWPMSGSTPPT